METQIDVCGRTIGQPRAAPGPCEAGLRRSARRRPSSSSRSAGRCCSRFRSRVSPSRRCTVEQTPRQSGRRPAAVVSRSGIAVRRPGQAPRDGEDPNRGTGVRPESQAVHQLSFGDGSSPQALSESYARTRPYMGPRFGRTIMVPGVGKMLRNRTPCRCRGSEQPPRVAQCIGAARPGAVVLGLFLVIVSSASAGGLPWEVWEDLHRLPELRLGDQVLLRSSHCPTGCRFDRHSATDLRLQLNREQQADSRQTVAASAAVRHRRRCARQRGSSD